MSRCWTCRRRRLKCDGDLPHCQKCLRSGEKCLGYTKPLTWVEGVARRGPMKNRTFGEAGHHAAVASVQHRSTLPAKVTDPLFQDLDNASRFFVDYFSKRVCPVVVVQDHEGNRFRGIIPLIQSSRVVASAVVALAACHFAHGLTGVPVAISSSNSTCRALSSDLNFSRAALVEHYLHSKATCLRLLSAALNDEDKIGEDSLFTTVVLLAVLDLIESGSGSWIFHLEGAKKLLEARSNNDQSSCGKNSMALLHEVVLFQAFGLSLAQPGALTSVSGFQPTPAISSLSPIACPVELVQAVEVFASQRRHLTVHIGALQETLTLVRQFDMQSWAAFMMQDKSAPSYDDLLHLGTIWRLSVEIYACRILRNLFEDATVALPPVGDLIAEFSFLDRENDDLIKCLIWPTFIAGASGDSLEGRKWALRTLDRIWAVALVANVQNAAQVLRSLWKRQDEIKSQNREAAPKDWDWLGELSRLEGSWLFV